MIQKKCDFKSRERFTKHKLGYTIHTSYLKMYHRLKCKIQNYKTCRRKIYMILSLVISF